MSSNYQLIKKDEIIRAYSHALKPLLQTSPCSQILDNLELLDATQQALFLKLVSTIKTGLRTHPNVDRELLNQTFQKSLGQLKYALRQKGVSFKEKKKKEPKVWHEYRNVRLNNVENKSSNV